MNPINTTITWLTWRQIFANRRFWLALAVAVVPAALAVVFNGVASDAATGANGFFVIMEREIVIGTLLPITAAVFGTTAFGGEIDDGTLIYLLVKPVPRWRVVISKYIAAVLATIAVMVPSVVLPWFIVRSTELPFEIARAFVNGALVGSILYSALFLLFGLITKRALTLGLLYVIGFEAVLARSGAIGVKSLSIREFAISVAQRTGDAAVQLGTPVISSETVRNVGLTMLVLTLALTVWRLRRYQVAERA